MVADSTLIRFYLEQKYQIDFDRALSAHDRGVAWSVEKMLEDHMYWIMVYWRWLKEENFARGPRQFLQARAGADPATGGEVRAQANPRHVASSRHRASLRSRNHCHGGARHRRARADPR